MSQSELAAQERSVHVWASAFIPHDKIRFPYPRVADLFAKWKGDGKPRVQDSARVWHSLDITARPGSDPRLDSKSNCGMTRVDYRWFGIGPRGTNTGTAAPPGPAKDDKDGSEVLLVTFSAEVVNPLVSMAPPIRYNFTLKINFSERSWVITGQHGRFPAFDLKVNEKTYLTYSPGWRNPLWLYRDLIGVDLSGDL
jgi:hypothetical protein